MVIPHFSAIGNSYISVEGFRNFSQKRKATYLSNAQGISVKNEKQFQEKESKIILPEILFSKREFQ